MASRKTRTEGAQTAESSVSVNEALSRLGLTHEQFQAKQAELLSVLLQNQPFVPQNATTRNLPLYDKSKLEQSIDSRSRSSSVSSASSRAASPVVPRTPVKSNHVDIVPPRPRDQMELILEERNRRKEWQRRGSTSRPREGERVFSTPSRGIDRAKTPTLPPDTPHHYKYYSERVVGEASSSKRTLDADAVPETPSKDRDLGRFKMPAPRYPKTPSKKAVASSCPSTPRSSPPPVVNLVSSPGPMRPAPLEGDHLPFTLPPGPYSTVKPDLSYAAIIGRAILASPNHALALQDIYEYITTVFPHYQRGEPTWMNSVRHALSTMAVFRKVQRGRAEGKSLWAIYSCDIACFEGGGFKKALCADMNNGASSSRGSRKRGAEERGGSRSKRKKANDEQSGSQPIMMPAPVLPPYFPHFTNTNPHHQSYYQAAMQQQQVPAEALFPPLPPSSNYHRVIARAASIPVADVPIGSSSSDVSAHDVADADTEDDFVPSSPIERPPSSSSLPDLVFGFSGSSSPALSSHHSLHDDSSPALSSTTMELPVDGDIDPVAAWLRSESPTLPPGLHAPPGVCDDEEKEKEGVSSEKDPEGRQSRTMASMGPPSSPSPERRKASILQRGLYRQCDKSAIAHPSTSTQENIAHATMTGGGSTRAPLLDPSLVASVLGTVSELSQNQERSSTPHHPMTPLTPSTPSRSDRPSTPSRLAQLESELFDFSPLKSGGQSLTARLPPMLPESPSLSIFNSRAPLLHMGSIEDFLAADPLPFPARSPAPPRTPKKSPLPSASMSSLSPLGTPSRTISRGSFLEFEDELTRYFPSPHHPTYETMIGGLSSTADAGSPSGLTQW